ncbi:hypothetical protein TNCV_3125011 [Trichonephila clavipes]|nr:hypothetical protein TNCV_3125011 [Trichonephila clavipes]
MDDSARPHREYVVSGYLLIIDITRMRWPPYSSDLPPNFIPNPAEVEKCTFRRVTCNSTRHDQNLVRSTTLVSLDTLTESDREWIEHCKGCGDTT